MKRLSVCVEDMIKLYKLVYVHIYIHFLYIRVLFHPAHVCVCVCVCLNYFYFYFFGCECMPMNISINKILLPFTVCSNFSFPFISLWLPKSIQMFHIYRSLFLSDYSSPAYIYRLSFRLFRDGIHHSSHICAPFPHCPTQTMNDRTNKRTKTQKRKMA